MREIILVAYVCTCSKFHQVHVDIFSIECTEENTAVFK